MPSSLRLYWIKTRFQNSINLAQPPLTQHLWPWTFFLSQRSGPRSICISLQGPQGPVSPISQKLSFLPKARTRSRYYRRHLRPKFCGLIVSRQTVFLSPAKTVAHSLSGSISQTFVKSSQAHSMASALK